MKMQPRFLDAKSVGLTGKVFWRMTVNCSSRQMFRFMCNIGIGKWVLLVT